MKVTLKNMKIPLWFGPFGSQPFIPAVLKSVLLKLFHGAVMKLYYACSVEFNANSLL